MHIAILGSEFRDRLELKGINDRTLGVGVSLSTDQLLILTANSMMKVSLDLGKIQGFHSEYGSLTQLLRISF